MSYLEECYLNSRNREKRFLNNPRVTNAWIRRLQEDNLVFAVYSLFEECDMEKAKQYFFTYGLLDAFRVRTYNDSHFIYDLYSIGYTMLSDNLLFLRNEYAQLDFVDFYLDERTGERITRTMEEHVLAGDDGCIFVHIIQQFLLNDDEMIQRDIEILEQKYPIDNQSLLRFDIDFFKALRSKDKETCEFIIYQMIRPEYHQQRNTDPLLKRYLSMPALGYTKLAWILGLKLEINSPLVPTELLPIQPLNLYLNPYDFFIS